MESFLQMLSALDHDPSTVGEVGKGEVYYSLLAFERIILKVEGDRLRLDEEVLLTPFYLDNGTYELHFYEMNIVFEDSSVIASKIGDSWSADLRRNLTIYETTRTDPVVSIAALKRYIEFLKYSYLVRSEIVSVFRKQPNLSNYYIAVY